jgi:DNA-binding CsgD family transcriptional regulator
MAVSSSDSEVTDAKLEVMDAQQDGPPRLTIATIGGERVAVFRYSCVPRVLPAELTPAERELAAMLLDGQDVNEMAQARGCSAGTIHHQLSAMYAKLGVDGHASLMARLLSLPGGTAARTTNGAGR